MQPHLVYKASLEVTVEFVGLCPLILEELCGDVFEVLVQLDHYYGGSYTLILGGLTACRAQININQDCNMLFKNKQKVPGLKFTHQSKHGRCIDWASDRCTSQRSSLH